jgi:hypothetical protein
MSVKSLLKNEIENLPEDVASEVFDYLRFIKSKNEKELLIKNAQKLSESSLEKIWDNDEDSVYDSL